MITCALCGQKSALPCGPKDHEVCPSCWLAVDCDDFLCMAPDLATALEWLESQRNAPSDYEMLMLLP